MSAVIDKPLAEYRRLAAELPGARNPAIAATRQRALERFSEHGLPTPRDEIWRYTNLTALGGRDLSPAGPGGAEGLAIGSFLLDAALPRLVFVDGRYVPSLSQVDEPGEGVSVATLGDLFRDAPEEAAVALAGEDAELRSDEPHALADLNAAFTSDGVVVRIAPGAAPALPLHILHVGSEAGGAAAAYPRNVIIAGAGSRATVIEHHVSAGDARTVVSAVTRCMLEEGASLEHCALNEQGEESFHFTRLSVHQARDSRFTSHNIQAGARVARVDLRVGLAEPGAACGLNGLYLGRGRQGVDNYTVVDHQAPHCSSSELYKGVLDGRSRGAFTGHVIVRQGAQKTNAQQMSRSLLLSDRAEADARPQLVIDADDVQCSHGATVGQLDHDALFYLRARGIGEDAARAMLVRAFAGEVIDRIGPEWLRRRVEALVTARLEEEGGT